MTFPGFCLSATPGSVPLCRQRFGKIATVGSCIGNRKSLDLDPAFLPNQGSGLCYGSRYPYFMVRLPVGVYVAGSGMQLFAELGGGGKISAAASAGGVSRPPAAGRGRQYNRAGGAGEMWGLLAPTPLGKVFTLQPEKNAAAFFRYFNRVSGKGLTFLDFCLSATPGNVPLRRRRFGKTATVGSRIGNRKSLDLDPPFMANQGSGLCYGSRYPYFMVRLPVGVYVVGSRTLVFAVLGGGGKISAAASISGISRPPSAGRGTLQTFVCGLYYRLRRFPASA